MRTIPPLTPDRHLTRAALQLAYDIDAASPALADVVRDAVARDGVDGLADLIGAGYADVVARIVGAAQARAAADSPLSADDVLDWFVDIVDRRDFPAFEAALEAVGEVLVAA